MTQLIIDGTEAVLSTSFSTTVKRENSILTKNGEYTYDCTLLLDNHTNRMLYGFLHRLNKQGSVTTKRSAVLVADGHVYCRGTEVITGWTEKEVRIQIVSGNSELNYFIGGDLLVEELTGMGEISGNIASLWITENNPTSDDLDFALPTIRDSANGNIYNQWKPGNDWPTLLGGAATQSSTTLRAQPYLCALIRKIITALGYTIGENQLAETFFANVFIVNTINTKKYYEMLPGWTVKEFLEEVEKLCDCIFAVDNINKTCDIYLKATFYEGSRAVPLRKVVDEYVAENVDPDAEHSSSDLAYSFEDGELQKLQDCEDMLGELAVITCSSVADVLTSMANVSPTDKIIAHIPDEDRYFIRIDNPISTSDKASDTYTYIEEVNMFAPLRRGNTEENVLEMGIVPVPMVCGVYQNGASYMEIAVVGTGDNVQSGEGGFGGHGSGTFSSDSPVENDVSVLELLKAGKSEEKKAKIQLYAGIYNGYHKERGGWMPTSYTDAQHAQEIAGLGYLMDEPDFPWDYTEIVNRYPGAYEGSLRFRNLDALIYNGAYTIDTTKSVTFETFDRMVANPHHVLNIKNKLWVIREIEETITAMGRKPKWKVVCHPINITATNEQLAWVLEDGTWNDGNPWYDHGQWLDEPEE